MGLNSGYDPVRCSRCTRRGGLLVVSSFTRSLKWLLQYPGLVLLVWVFLRYTILRSGIKTEAEEKRRFGFYLLKCCKDDIVRNCVECSLVLLRAQVKVLQLQPTSYFYFTTVRPNLYVSNQLFYFKSSGASYVSAFYIQVDWLMVGSILEIPDSSKTMSSRIILTIWMVQAR